MYSRFLKTQSAGWGRRTWNSAARGPADRRGILKSETSIRVGSQNAIRPSRRASTGLDSSQDALFQANSANMARDLMVLGTGRC